MREQEESGSNRCLVTVSGLAKLESRAAVRVLLAAASLSCCIAGFSAHGAEPAWKPQKNVELVVGAQAGGSNDRMARLLQKVLTESGAAPSMTVVNKPGQGQTLAVAYINTHPGDPHYLLMLGSSWITSSIAARATTTHRDFTPITKLVNGDLVLSVTADSPLRTVKDLVEGLRKDVTQYSFGFSTSAGNASHIALAELARLAGADPRKLRVIVNASGSITATQLAGGHINAGVNSSGTIQAMVALGKARMIGAISSQRLPQLPDLPTLREQGYDVVASTWFAMFGPKGLAPAQARYWEDALVKAMRHPETKQFADANNWTIELTGSRELPVELDREYARLRATLNELGMIK
jgi:putative tricarboxylic transport membrane protein